MLLFDYRFLSLGGYRFIVSFGCLYSMVGVKVFMIYVFGWYKFFLFIKRKNGK